MMALMEEVDPDKLPPGTMVDTYRVVRRLGGGAYGTVYLVEEKGAFYALKIARIREQHEDKRHTAERAQRELSCLLTLRHRYIAQVFAYSRWPHREEGYIYMVMEYVEGGTLARWCEDNRATAHEVTGLIEQVLEAVAYMHSHGIFHRDLKPGNILVSKGGKEPKVVDFGVAHFPLPALPQLTDTVLPPGTPRYTSPEALRFEAQNRRNRTARYEFTVADELYALGVTLYDLLTDPRPDSNPQPIALGFAWMPTPYAHEVNERVPVPLSHFTASLLEERPERRPVSAEVARRNLVELREHQPEEGLQRPLHPPPPLPPKVLPAAPVQVEPMPGQPGQPVEAAAARSKLVASSQPGGLRRWGRARAVAAGAVALGALLACGVYLGLRAGAPVQPAPVAEGSPPPLPPTPEANAEPLPTPPAPSPAQPLPTPEKGTPVNSRQAPAASVSSLCSQKTPPPRSTSRWREWCKCAGITGTLVALQAGCPGAQVRQSPTEECRKEAVEAMKLLDLRFARQEIDVQADLAFPRAPGAYECESGTGPCIQHPGPATSLVVEGSGALVKGTLLKGHVFESPNNKDAIARGFEGVWVYRWTEATLPNGDKHPVCIEASHSRGPCPDGSGGKETCVQQLGSPVKKWRISIIP